MKRKLRLLIFMMLCFTSFMQAQKTDVWDFGALGQPAVTNTPFDDTNLYTKQLTVAVINAWYPGTIIPGSANTTTNVMPATFTAGDLKWVGGTNDRLRTSNIAVTRYDGTLGNVGTTGCTGRLYVNGAAQTGRYLELSLKADDEVTLIACGDAAGLLNFEYVTGPQIQKDQSVTTATAAEYKYVAKYTGNYRIYDSSNKPSYYRILRKPATYASITGTIDETLAAGIPAGYSVSFTNAAGKVFTAPVTSGAYSVNLPAGYSYELGLVNANGFVINNGTSLNVLATTTSYDISIEKVTLFTVTGNVSGLTSADLTKLSLVYTPDASLNKIYVPKPLINTTTGTYTVDLEADTPYTVSGTGVNNFEILANTVNISAATTKDVVFSAKPVYDVTLNVSGLNATQLANLKLTFTNKNEAGYVYNFNYGSSIKLRKGTYFFSYTGIDSDPVESGLLSNVIVNNTATSKALEFKPVTNWSFDDRTITTSATTYKGMLFGGTAGTISNRIANGDLTAKSGGTIQIPVNVGDKIIVSYYYSADFSIDGGAAIKTTSGSTSNVEKVEYAYGGSAPGYVTITMGGVAGYTTYITDVTIGGSIPYSSTITVGTDKTYKTINDALTAVSKMTRTATDRVTIMVDPGNYEEMLVITQPNVTLKNAATTPSVALSNKGVDIDPNAVRVTSYYGHGYTYYSMSSDQKWHSDVLKVNKENGYFSYVNTGAGTTNGSYWNATVVINAAGFEADNIIFENSFNQYISKKESEDIVVEWTSGGKGTRPTAIGNTTVQNKSFVERAAAIAVLDNVQKVILNNCRVIGRQDSFYGGKGARVAVYKGVMMGGTDYLFGGMDAVFYKTALAMNTSEDNNDVSYITAAQQDAGRGYLMYECTVTSATPGTETASLFRSKPGYFGRPWSANGEVVFYNTTIETSDNPSFSGQSLIVAAGWNNSLGSSSTSVYEYGTIENSGVDNQASRVSWSTKPTTPTLTGGVAINTLNFTKGSDGWDPFPQLIANDPSLGIKKYQPQSAVNVFGSKNKIAVSNVKSKSQVLVYAITGALVKSFEIDSDTNFDMKSGIWIVVVQAEDGQKAVKVMTY